MPRKKKPARKIQYETTWQCQSLCDGAKTLVDIARAMRLGSEQLERMHIAGVTLKAKVEHGYAIFVTGNKAVAKEYDMEEVLSDSDDDD